MLWNVWKKDYDHKTLFKHGLSISQKKEKNLQTDHKSLFAIKYLVCRSFIPLFSLWLSLSLCVLKLSSIIFSIYDMFDLSYIWVLIHRLLLQPYFHISRLSWFVYEWQEPDFFHKMCQTPDISYCFALVNIFYVYGCRSYA